MEKLGCEERNSATRVGWDQRAGGVRSVGLCGQEKRCWTVSGTSGQWGQLGEGAALME
jgi:hypothetical protein